MCEDHGPMYTLVDILQPFQLCPVWMEGEGEKGTKKDSFNVVWMLSKEQKNERRMKIYVWMQREGKREKGQKND